MSTSHKCAVYIMSCDANRDVSVHMIKSLERYFCDFPYDLYFGLNEDVTVCKSDLIKFIPVRSKRGGWRNESLEQIDRIKEIDPLLTHVLLILDDFVFTQKVDKMLVTTLISQAMENGISYLVMKKPLAGLFERIFAFARNRVKGISTPVYKIPRSYDYYHSLQVALWNMEYLKSKIGVCTNIWEFEHIEEKSVQHYNVGKNVLEYTHIVEKGEWDFEACELCLKHIGYFNPGNRRFRTYRAPAGNVLMNNIIKYFFGYQGFVYLRKLKKYFEKG